MAGIVMKQVVGYTADPTAGPTASFSFETFVGLGPLLYVEEHRGLIDPAQAETLLWKLHRRNLATSWLAGFPGLFPALSYLSYRSQLARVRRQAAAGVLAPLPGIETPAETRAAVAAFVGIIVFAFAGIVVWRWADPAGFDQFADRVRSR